MQHQHRVRVRENGYRDRSTHLLEQRTLQDGTVRFGTVRYGTESHRCKGRNGLLTFGLSMKKQQLVGSCISLDAGRDRKIEI